MAQKLILLCCCPTSAMRRAVFPSDDAADARHRTMRITDAGRAALRVELEQMARVSQAGLRALGPA